MRSVNLFLLSCARSKALIRSSQAQAGRTDRQVPDPAAADRGKRVYLQFCINCHGSQAQGTEDGPDLIRSTIVLHDRLEATSDPRSRSWATTKRTSPGPGRRSVELFEAARGGHDQGPQRD